MRSNKLILGPAEVLGESAVNTDADVWLAFEDHEEIKVPDDSVVATWLSRVAHARDWKIDKVHDVRRWISERYPSLKPYLDSLDAAGDTETPSSLWQWAEKKLGAPHTATPSAEHAEQVARWRLGSELSEAQAALLSTAAAALAGDQFSSMYLFASGATKEDIVQRLVGEQEPVFQGEFQPGDDLTTANAIEAWTIGRLTDQGANGLRKALTSKSSRSAKAIVAKGYATAVANGHPAEPSMVDLLQALLDGKHYSMLVEACPPSDPDPVPEDHSLLAGWFEKSYLPYRRWMHLRGIAADEVVKPIWTSFADAYLAAVQSGIGSGAGPLAMHRSRALDAEQGTTLFVILDGPLPDDAQSLVRGLRASNANWSVVETEWLLAAVPTVTEICRPSMTSGLAASYVEESDDAVSTLGQAKKLLEQGSTLVIVKLLQPDKAYETMNVSDVTLRRVARAQIQMIAEELADVATEVHLDRIIICADHGRCWGQVEPVIEKPAAGKVHRRAVLGVPRSLLRIPDRTRRLDGELYAFSSDTDGLVAEGATTFVGANHVWYPHGGLLPEEGFVQWVELRRGALTVGVVGYGELHGIQGRAGHLQLNLTNQSLVAIEFLQASWEADGSMVHASAEAMKILPATTTSITLDVPTIGDRVSPQATIEVRTPDGNISAISVPLSVHVRKMQSQSIDLLGDL
jgi:hypothetical protein